jgi:hypothetical protein
MPLLRVLIGCMILCAVTRVDAAIERWYLPIGVSNRQNSNEIELTAIGTFGTIRKARPGIPAHHHTGVDFKRPTENYTDEPIYPAAKGTVISLRDDGPYAQIIIEHVMADSVKLWTVYEHVAGITVHPHEVVDPQKPIARFMTTAELNQHGWQFDHVHFEVMKIAPRPRTPDKKRPYLQFGTYCLVCYTQKELQYYYHHPLEFFRDKWQSTAQAFSD